MAQIHQMQKHTIIFLFSLIIQTQSHQFSTKLSPKSLGLTKEKLTHLHFYSHDVMSHGPPTVVKVAQAATSNTSKTGFGTTVIADDPLTAGPEVTSKSVGRTQGITFISNYVFSEGKYNGSTLSILGRNAVNSPVREMPIVGGTGIFRFTRGYALTKTLYSNASNGDATIEYDVYVLH